MRKPQDILLNSDLTLKVENGDFVIGDATEQHQRLLLLTEKGGMLTAPLAGVGARSFLHDENPADLLREIRQQFIKDGMEVLSLKIEQGKIKVNAYYK